jgi:Icc-related predicted phosphoesterase
MLIHAGDITSRGSFSEVEDFLDWFSQTCFKHKVFIPGNHDFFFENAADASSVIPEGITYLNDSGVEIEGINIWGSPVTPWFYDWAFNRQRGAEIRRHWDLIPRKVDILITHGPVYGILDRTARGECVGCEDLMKAVTNVKPKVFVSGHIHEAYGAEVRNDILFVNASVLDLSYVMANKPVVFDLVIG